MNDWISKVREQVLTIVEDNQPDEKVTAEEETTPPETVLEHAKRTSQEYFGKMEEEAKVKAVLDRSAQQCLEMALQQEEARKVLVQKAVKATKSSIEKKVETLEKKVAKQEKTVAKHYKVLKEFRTKSLQQEVEDLKNENSELKNILLKLAKRVEEVEVKLVEEFNAVVSVGSLNGNEEGSIDMTRVDLEQLTDGILLKTKAATDKLFAEHRARRKRSTVNDKY
jgi:hypothetical protein